MTSEMIRRIIDGTLNQLGRDASYDDYINTAHALFPEEMDALGKSFERQGFIKWLKDGMRQVANVGEEDKNAPSIQMKLLPGLPAPAYINIGSEDEPKLIKFTDCSADDLRLAIDKRRIKAAQISKRVEDLQQKLQWLTANRETELETIGHACQRLGGSVTPAVPMPTEGLGDRPQ